MLKPTPRVKQPEQEQGAGNHTLRSLFDAEEANLLRYAFYLTGRRAVAEEIVQDVFLQLHKRWEQVRQPKAWLFRVVRNKAFNYLRSNQRETPDGDQAAHTEAGRSEPPDQRLERLETTAELRKLLEELNDTDQQLVKLKYFEGLKYKEISQQTGLTVSNVGYRLHHILKHLAIKLRSLGADQ